MKLHLRHGITLIELLVVVSIMVLLGALVVPNMTPSIETRKIREAARGVDAFLASAKGRAISTGRPVGVLISQASNNARAGLTLFQADVPADYSGDLYDYSSDCNMYLQATSATTVTAGLHIGFGIKSIIGNGDLIQFGGKGLIYKIDSVDSSGLYYTLTFDSRGTQLPWPSAPNWSGPVPFRIIRKPIVLDRDLNKIGMASGSSNYYQLPDGAAIDLIGSVFPGANVNIPAAPDNTPCYLTIVFSPSGGVSAIYSGQATRYLPSGSIHLLIGKLKSIQATASSVPALPNWLDTANRYVSIGHLTGQVKTTEVAPVSGASNQQQEIWQATALTRDNFETGGR